MEIKRYDDFSSLKPIEDRIREVIDLFPEIDDLIDIFTSIDDVKIQHITPALYRSAAISYKQWFGGIYLDEVEYFDLKKTGDRSILEELYFQEMIYPEKKLEEFTKKWKRFKIQDIGTFKQIFQKMSKKKLVAIIKYLGITFDEVVVDIVLNEVSFNSIEWRRKGNQVILHKFIDEIDYEFNYDELPNKLKRDIYLFLLREFLN